MPDFPVWLPAGLPKPLYIHLVPHGVAPTGVLLAPYMAHRWPPSDRVPLGPASPKYTTSPFPSGFATTGEAAVMPPRDCDLQIKAPVVAFSAYSCQSPSPK